MPDFLFIVGGDAAQGRVDDEVVFCDIDGAPGVELILERRLKTKTPIAGLEILDRKNDPALVQDLKAHGFDELVECSLFKFMTVFFQEREYTVFRVFQATPAGGIIPVFPS